MEAIFVCELPNGDFEEVPKNIFDLRDQIMSNEEEQRYTSGYVTIKGGKMQIQVDNLDIHRYSLLGRSFGLNLPTKGKQIKPCPEFLYIKQRKGCKNKLINTQTGDIYRK